MTNKEKKHQIADILMDFYDEYDSNVINRPMIPNIYAGKILDSMQEEPVSEDLKDEIKSWLNEGLPNEKELVEHIKETARHFVKWQKEQDKETIEIAEDHAMLAGRMRMKEEMMAKAINATIGSFTNGTIYDADFDISSNLKDNDKVKVIVIKEN